MYQKTASDRLKMGVCARDTSMKSFNEVDSREATGPTSMQPSMQIIKTKSPKRGEPPKKRVRNTIGKSFTFGPRKIYAEDPNGPGIDPIDIPV